MHPCHLFLHRVNLLLGIVGRKDTGQDYASDDQGNHQLHQSEAHGIIFHYFFPVRHVYRHPDPPLIYQSQNALELISHFCKVITPLVWAPIP